MILAYSDDLETFFFIVNSVLYTRSAVDECACSSTL